MKVLLIFLLTIHTITICRAGTVRQDRSTAGGEITGNETLDQNNNGELKSDVLDTIDTLKTVLKKFEDKWVEPNATEATEQTHPAAMVAEARAAPRNQYREPEPIEITYEKRNSNGKVYGCPHAWPYHDAYPVHESLCASDNECGEGQLCCQLFHHNHCLRAMDATPKPGECRFTQFNPLSQSHCMIDDPGCLYDSECADPTWKCCKGPCHYNECLPSTDSPTPAELAQRQQSPTAVPVALTQPEGPNNIEPPPPPTATRIATLQQLSNTDEPVSRTQVVSQRRPVTTTSIPVNIRSDSQREPAQPTPALIGVPAPNVPTTQAPTSKAQTVNRERVVQPTGRSDTRPTAVTASLRANEENQAAESRHQPRAQSSPPRAQSSPPRARSSPPAPRPQQPSTRSESPQDGFGSPSNSGNDFFENSPSSSTTGNPFQSTTFGRIMQPTRSQSNGFFNNRLPSALPIPYTNLFGSETQSNREGTTLNMFESPFFPFSFNGFTKR